ncbi:MAG: DUF4843 domain-containing protein [Pseudobacter sp.]|uniref:DUF4843 domain-containing protein n=1 Tax=Pseudobacter sp. TaxID=2045420 RepID=UPI003F7EC8E6
MKYIKYILIITLIPCFAACSKESLEVWNTSNKLWFANMDTLVFASFKKMPPEVSELNVEVAVQMAGQTADHDRTFTVEVLKDKRNPATSYSIRNAVVPADSLRGHFKVTINKTPNLAVDADTVTFVLRTSGEFETGLSANLNCTFIISNKYIQPSWWYDYTCGTYSEAKHEVVFAVFGNDDDIRGRGADPYYNTYNWMHVDALYNLWKLNKYCEEHGLPFRFAEGK